MCDVANTDDFHVRFFHPVNHKVDFVREEFASSGVGIAGRVAGTRELVADKIYLVIYRVKRTNVEIIRVRHMRQKHPKNSVGHGERL